MKSDLSYVLLAILIVFLAGFFNMPDLTGYQAFGPIAPTTSGTQIAPSSITAPSGTTSQKIVLTTGACPVGYSLAGSTTLSYSTTGSTSAAYAWSANKANPSISQDYTAIITGPTTTGRVNYCILSGSNMFQVTSGYKACTAPYDGTPSTGNRGAIGSNIIAQSFSQTINPPGSGAIFTACTTQPRTYGQDCSANNQCASNSCDFSVGKCNVYERQTLMLDATLSNQLTTGPYPVRAPDFAKQCPTGYEAAGMVANLESISYVLGGPSTGINSWYYTLICAKGSGSTYITSTITQQPIGPSGPTITTTTTQPSAPTIPTPSTRLMVIANGCGTAVETCSNLKGQFVPGQNSCDGMPVAYSSNGISLDAGWVGLCSDHTLLVSVYDDCSSFRASCPSNYTNVGGIHTAPGVCDQWLEGVDYANINLNSGWLAFCTRNSDVVITIERDDCGQIVRESCPLGYNYAGTVHTGPGGRCDGMPEGYSTSGKTIDSGWLGICVKTITTTPSAPITPTATCTDGVRNQDETGVDCGGTICSARCGSGSSCNLISDCVSGTSCVSNICTTTAIAIPSGEILIPPTRVGVPVDVPFQSHCFNGITDADETDVDCGGSGCGGCGFNKTCSTTIGYGCVSGLTCSSGRCKKIAGQLCTLSSECASSLSCINGRCGTTPTPTIQPGAPGISTISAGGGGGGGGRTAAVRVCGNKKLDVGEQCDDGNILNDDGCTKECTIEYCGDGVIQHSVKEECDPPDSIRCSLGCTLIAEAPSKIIPAPKVEIKEEPVVVYQPPTLEQRPSRLKYILITVAAIVAASLGVWLVRKKFFKRPQRPYVLPVRYSRGSR